MSTPDPSWFFGGPNPVDFFDGPGGFYWQTNVTPPVNFVLYFVGQPASDWTAGRSRTTWSSGDVTNQGD